MASFIGKWVLPMRASRETPIDRCWGKRIRAYYTETPGLLVHNSIKDGKGWVIVHEASGLWVAHLFSKKDSAVNMAGDLGDWDVDWTQDPDTIRAIEGLHERVAATQREWWKLEADQLRDKREAKEKAARKAHEEAQAFS